MIDYDKLEKVGEYKDGSLAWFADKEENVVYLIQIGEDAYIGSTEELYNRVLNHISLLKKNFHTSETMQAAFNEYKTFTVYILERVLANDNLKSHEQIYINTFLPKYNTATAYRELTSKYLDLESIIKKQGLSKNILAETMGITISGLYTLLKNPTYKTLSKIADALGVGITDLFEKSSDEVVGAIRIGDSTHVVNSKEDIKKLAENL